MPKLGYFVILQTNIIFGITLHEKKTSNTIRKFERMFQWKFCENLRLRVGHLVHFRTCLALAAGHIANGVYVFFMHSFNEECPKFTHASLTF